MDKVLKINNADFNALRTVANECGYKALLWDGFIYIKTISQEWVVTIFTEKDIVK